MAISYVKSGRIFYKSILINTCILVSSFNAYTDLIMRPADVEGFSINIDRRDTSVTQMGYMQMTLPALLIDNYMSMKRILDIVKTSSNKLVSI